MGANAIAGKRSKRFKWSVRLGVAFLVYTLAGFFIVPAVIKSQMLKRLPALTHRQAAVQQVKVNPLSFSLTIRGFSLKEPDGEVFASFDEYYVNFQPIASLFHWSWVFRDVSVIRPFIQITYKPDGTFNFANLIDVKTAEPKKPAPPPPALIYLLFVTNGTVAFADLKRAEPFRTQFTPIHLHLTNLTTVRDRNSPYSFEAHTADGETFAWTGRVSVNPLNSAGEFRFTGLRFGKYTPYSRDYTRFEIVNGRVDVAADYRYDSATNALDLVLSNASVRVSRLELRSPDTGEMVINIPALAVTDTEASVAARTATIGHIKSTRGSLLVRREHDGSINLLSLLKLPAKDPSVAAPVTGPAPATGPIPFNAKINEIVFDDYTFKIEDKQPAKPASFNIDQLGFSVKGVSTASNAPVTAALSLRFQETGNVTVNGTATLLPPSADLQVALTNIDLRAIQPYVEEQVKLVVTGGALDLQGRARYTPSQAGAPMANFTGSLAVNKFLTTDDILFKEFTKWDALTVDGIKLDVQPDQLQVEQVKVAGLSTSVIVGPDRRPNLQTILRDKLANTNNAAGTNAAPVTASSPPAKRELPNVALGALVLENASIHFSDQSLEPHCNFDVQEFGGSVTGLSSKPDSTATVDMKGKVDDRSPFSVGGKVNPLAGELTADLTVTFTNTELTAFSPYTERLAGRPLEKGKLSFAVHYKIEKNAVKAENGFYVDQLTLGAKNNSPDATSLPVKLAIALLKDRNGRIQLDVPVEGRVDDPKFRVGPIIWHVIVNLMVKAATSPFALLGAAFGGGEELSFVEFAPGLSDLSESEAKKLDVLAKSLYERPAVSLEISSSVDPVKDRVPLARVKLDQQLKSLWVKEQSDAGKAAVPLDQINLDPDERERLLRKTHRNTFGRYKPTEVPADAAAGPGTTSIAAMLATMPKSSGNERGATMLMKSSQASAAVARPAATGAASASAAAPAAPLTRAQLELADMEDQLVQKIEITNDDLRDLMQQRANKVQAYLLKTDKVTAERLFIIAPKAIGPGFKPEDRVNLSLN